MCTILLVFSLSINFQTYILGAHVYILTHSLEPKALKKRTYHANCIEE